MNLCDLRDEVRAANFLLLRKIMQWKEQELPGKYDSDFVWWILQDYTEGGLVGIEREEQRKNAKELLSELLKLDSETHIKRMPSMYQNMYHFIKMCAEGQYQGQFYYSYKESDHYMEQQPRPVKELIRLHKAPIRRIYEAICFHEFRHFMTRVWIWMGNEY